MVEPTETESLETLDIFIEHMKEVAKECKDNPEHVLDAPHTTTIKKIDEVLAARKPVLRWQNGDL